MKRLVATALLSLAMVVLVGAVAFASARGSAAPTPGRQTVDAPIERIQVVIRDANPPLVSVNIKAGLPSGCAQPDSHSVSRVGDTITVRVLNTMPAGEAICTMIYGTYDLNVDLGRDFRAGATYTVKVNDKTTTFKV
jgi:hypothetical protein